MFACSRSGSSAFMCIRPQRTCCSHVIQTSYNLLSLRERFNYTIPSVPTSSDDVCAFNSILDCSLSGSGAFTCYLDLLRDILVSSMLSSNNTQISCIVQRHLWICCFMCLRSNWQCSLHMRSASEVFAHIILGLPTNYYEIL